MIHLEKNNLNELVETGIHLVDFYAQWCGPCKMLTGELEKLENDIDIIKVDIDSFPELASEYRVMSVPTLIFFKDGKKEEEIIGFHPYDDLKEIVEKIK